MFDFRPAQKEIMKYRNGKMGIAAVPGSGKTFTLSHLAAKIIAENEFMDDQEVLVVTLVNAAVDNFSQKINQWTQERGLLPGFGFRVRTLHGLAHDIVRERPDLVGLPNNFQIIDERETNEILRSAVNSWMRSHSDVLLTWLREDKDLFRDHKISKDMSDWLLKVNTAFIRQAKDLRASPEEIRRRLDIAAVHDDLLEMGWQIYQDYQRALIYRSAVDFDDLISMALTALKADPDFLLRLKHRWPFILEDEAQDSSRLQEEILRLLSGENGNWVRVGDPNQAIYETFTTASPKYLLNFIHEPDVVSFTLPESSRSTFSIMEAANYLIQWTRTSHPNLGLRDALTQAVILPVDPAAGETNPADQPDGIKLISKPFESEKELEAVVRSLESWLKTNSDKTVAVLLPRRDRVEKLIDLLNEKKIPFKEMLSANLAARESADILARIIRGLIEPHSKKSLRETFSTIYLTNPDPVWVTSIQAAENALNACDRPEEFFWPQPGKNWLDDFALSGPPDVVQILKNYRSLLCEWQEAAVLPVDQLIITISNRLFQEPTDLALAHKIATVLAHAGRNHPDWQLPEFLTELEEISRTQRGFDAFFDDRSGYNPEQDQGVVILSTMHKAKGLEWDRVYLTSVSNYDFPSAVPGDNFISEKYYIKQNLNLQAEIIGKLNALFDPDPSAVFLETGSYTQNARDEYAAERLRLFYVGITRAKEELTVTWNTGRRKENVEALPLVALRTYWENKHASS